jgi:hypothetical protein
MGESVSLETNEADIEVLVMSVKGRVAMVIPRTKALPCRSVHR